MTLFKEAALRARSDYFEEIRWYFITFALAGAVWIAAFAGLLVVANHVHVDVPYVLAVKLPLLRSRPDLIFAGDSRTEYQVDAEPRYLRDEPA